MDEKLPTLIIEEKTDRIIAEFWLYKGQTYEIPEGYDFCYKTVQGHLEKCFVRKTN